MAKLDGSGRRHDRLPLVFATPHACAQWLELGVDGVLENVVAAAIRAGNVVFGGRQEAKVRLDDERVAVAMREPSPVTGRRSWRIVRIESGRSRQRVG